MDLFASRISYQLEKYVSFKPDPSAVAIDTFTPDWADPNFYAFSPFIVISIVVRKIQGNCHLCTFQLANLSLVSNSHGSVGPPIELKPNKNLLSLPSHRQELHPLQEKLSLFASYQKETRKYRTIFTYAIHYIGFLKIGDSQTIQNVLVTLGIVL